MNIALSFYISMHILRLLFSSLLQRMVKEHTVPNERKIVFAFAQLNSIYRFSYIRTI